MQQGPALLAGQQTRREDHSVEGDVVFAHELVQLDFAGVLPPLLVLLLEVVGSDRDVADRGVEPHVEHFLLEALDGDGHSPLQVSGDALWLEAHVQPGLRHCDRVLRPFALLAALQDPLLEIGLDHGEVDEEVFGFPLDWLGFADFAFGILELDRTVEKPLAFVALVAFGLVVLATGACSKYKPISQEEVTLFAIALLQLVLENAVVLLDVEEDLLGDGGVPGRAGPPKVVKLYVEPLVDAVMDLEVVVANLFGRLPLLEGLDFGGCAVFVGPTYIHNIVSVESLVPGIHIGRKHTADNVAQVGHVVHVRESRCD